MECYLNETTKLDSMYTLHLYLKVINSLIEKCENSKFVENIDFNLENNLEIWNTITLMFHILNNAFIITKLKN